MSSRTKRKSPGSHRPRRIKSVTPKPRVEKVAPLQPRAAGTQTLSPMQAGMLFQYVLSEGVSDRGGYDIEQLHIRLQEALDGRALSRAFSFVARRHPILSVAFSWEGVEAPQQELLAPNQGTSLTCPASQASKRPAVTSSYLAGSFYNGSTQPRLTELRVVR